MRNKLLSAGIIGFGLAVSAMIVINGAYAQTDPTTIQFPVAELGNCKDKDACKVYCDDANHLNACLAFAERNNLMSEDEIAVAKKFMEAGGKGPGGCTSKEACQAYCDDISHIDACIAFAEEAGILPPEELAEAKQVQAAIAKGVKPPACRGKKACDAYCEDSSHMKECIVFGEAAGFLNGKDLEDAKKVLIAIDNGATPPPCRGKEACDAYCSEPDHMEACMTFAQAAGFMTPEETQNSQKMLEALKKGVKPPACRGKEECDAYCSLPAHADECIQFSVAAGFMTEEEAEMAKRTGGKGPGGCIGKDTCEAFCGNPDNQQVCIDFAKENGFDMSSGGPGPGPGAPPEGFNAIERDGNYQQGEQGAIQGGEGFGGPGGCKSQEECMAYCKDHPQECQNFAPPNQQQQYQQQPPSGAQFTPGMYPNQMPPPEGTSGAYPDQLPQFAPGTYPNQPPPGGEGTPGTYPYQQPTQFAPGTYPTYPDQPPPGEEGASAYPYQQSTQFVPEAEPTMPPIEQTAPQSSNFDLSSSLAAVITAFKEFLF